MRNIFATTANTDLFVNLCTSLEQRDAGIPGLGLICGPPGVGKSRTSIWYCDRVGAVFVRALATATLRSFLEDLVIELNQEPAFRTADLYRQAERALSENRRLLVVDEIDRFISHWQSIEMLRDLSDRTGCSVLMVGMESSERKLARFRHVYYRMKSHIMQFTPLSEGDTRRFVDQVSEVELADSAISEIYKISGGRVGDIVAEIYQAERIARANDFSTIEGKHLKRRAA